MTDKVDIITKVAYATCLPTEKVKQVLEAYTDNLGWDQLHKYHEELRRGQCVYEDAGGYFIRAIKALFGCKIRRDELETYQEATRRLIEASNG